MRDYMRARYNGRMQHALATLGNRCKKCGSTQHLELDHVDPATKTRNVSALTAVGTRRFLSEVKKCQALCSKCHQEKTLAERGLTKKKGVHGSYTNYRHYGCRCDLCKAANAERLREYRTRTGKR